MGNCLRRNRISSAQEHEAKAVEEMKMKMKLSAKTKSEPAPRRKESNKFKAKENGRSGAIRIKVVVTREELKRILSYEKDSQKTTLEQLLSAMKLRGRGEYEGDTNTWRPSLESIPEDHSLK